MSQRLFPREKYADSVGILDGSLGRRRNSIVGNLSRRSFLLGCTFMAVIEGIMWGFEYFQESIEDEFDELEDLARFYHGIYPEGERNFSFDNKAFWPRMPIENALTRKVRTNANDEIWKRKQDDLFHFKRKEL
eukprot:TRINITY_DN6022_c0_g1_i1.p1 TRINITY_DN6022_c0_g1~~TRINITY_DN6022_c0_g1_i1.p1  ORF type:complete len:133 (-),score=28.44 TRINITY_DN6022_c0_g1_i1:94-492(-)